MIARLPTLPSPDGPTLQWFRFVTYADVARYQAAGWAVCTDLGHPHERYAVLMRYERDGEPA